MKIGDFSRGGRTRGDPHAGDHDLGGQEQYIPGGSVAEDTGPLSLTFGRSSKTSAVIVETLEARGAAWDEAEQAASELVQIKRDNGPESRGVRTQLLPRMGQFADQSGNPRHLLYYPPSHRNYNPIERGWGIVELHGHGTKLVDVETMREWAKSMTWTGIPPVVELSRKGYQKGMALGKKARQAVESRLERHPELPKWDILIRPASTA